MFGVRPDPRAAKGFTEADCQSAAPSISQRGVIDTLPAAAGGEAVYLAVPAQEIVEGPAPVAAIPRENYLDSTRSGRCALRNGLYCISPSRTWCCHQESRKA